MRDKLPIKEICRQTGLSRNTVRAWLREPDMVEPRYPARRVITKLDDYAETLRTWLKADAGRNKRERCTKGQMWRGLVCAGLHRRVWPSLRLCTSVGDKPRPGGSIRRVYPFEV